VTRLGPASRTRVDPVSVKRSTCSAFSLTVAPKRSNRSGRVCA
jgi:hypothetical protein